MGVSHSPQELAAKFNGLAEDLQKRKTVALNKAAFASKVAFLAAPGAPHGKINVGARGTRVGVRYKINGDTASVRWYGPVHLVNNPTKKHKIAPKKRRGRHAIAFSGVVVASAKHPGTHGKHFFEVGRKIAEKESAVVFRREMHGAIVDRFK